MKGTLTRKEIEKEIERFNRVEVPLKDKIKFVIWFSLSMIILTLIGIWQSRGFRWS